MSKDLRRDRGKDMERQPEVPHSSMPLKDCSSAVLAHGGRGLESPEGKGCWFARPTLRQPNPPGGPGTGPAKHHCSGLRIKRIYKEILFSRGLSQVKITSPAC